MFLFKFITVLILSVPVVIPAKLPRFIRTCRIRQADFRECAIKNGNLAIPFVASGDRTFGIPSFDPLKLPLIEFASAELKLNGTDVVITGIPNIILNDFKFDAKTREAYLNVSNPETELNFNYNVGGRISSLPIEGAGRGKIILYNAFYLYKFDFQYYEKRGNQHIEVINDNFEAKPQKMFINLDNLFHGNKLLGDNMNKFLNENWQEFLVEFRPAINEIVGSIVRRIVYTLFKKVPLKEVFPDF